MTPVDGITPPKKISKKRPPKTKVVKKKPAEVTESKPQKTIPQKNDRLKKINNDHKFKLVWVISIIIVVIIFILWAII